jgi:beta-mannanase
MIYFNGTRALRGILGPSEFNLIKDTSMSSDCQKLYPLSRLDFGAYDPEGTLEKSKLINYEMVYLSWLDFQPKVITSKLNQIRTSQRLPVLTIEPWARNEQTLLTDICKGHYDTELKSIGDLAAGFGDTLLISWGHEMDQDITKRYPWSGKSPQEFIAAYQYVHKFFTTLTKGKVKWIWAPVAKEGSKLYYPGDNFVDVIGLPIYAFPEWENSYRGYIKSFDETYTEKTDYLKDIDKPIFLTEFGMSGADDFKSFWIRQAFLSFRKYKNLKAVFFFQAKETPGVWGSDISSPDWQLPASTIETMIDWAKSAK